MKIGKVSLKVRSVFCEYRLGRTAMEMSTCVQRLMMRSMRVFMNEKVITTALEKVKLNS